MADIAASLDDERLHLPSEMRCRVLRKPWPHDVALFAESARVSVKLTGKGCRVFLWWTWLMLAALAAGCTSEQIYNSAQGWRRNECYKLGDLDQRERCLKDANRPYDAYRAASSQSR